MQEMLETQVLSLGREDPLEEGMGIHWRESTPAFLLQEPMGRIKRQKDMTLEDEPPQVGR